MSRGGDSAPAAIGQKGRLLVLQASDTGELQTLEEVLRGGREDAIATVARTIRDKAGIADDGDDYGFLSDYYAALCARLEGGLLVGRRRENKFEAASGRA